VNTPPPTIEPLGECAVLVRFGDRIEQAINARVHQAARAVEEARLAGVIDIVPAYASLAVQYEPRAWRGTGDAGELPWRRISARIEGLLDACADAPTGTPRRIDIAVRYGGADGPDLDAVAAHAGLYPDEVVARHAAGDYRVAMLGFAPGFAYLLGLDPALHMPRRADPRIRVPAGSIAIGGAQTGIYPRDLPGGWQLIGRTDEVLFNVAHRPPNRLAPGDRVRFVPVCGALKP
jgi:KipI family sensor histidine kinase inhibitor